MATSKGGRPPTGRPRWSSRRGCWEAHVIHIADDGTKTDVPVPMRTIAKDDEAGAVRLAEIIARKHKVSGMVPLESAETANEWYDRYHAYQRELGQTDAVKKHSRWKKWIAPKIGTKPMAAVTRDDVEDVRDALDDAIAAWKRAGKSSGKLGAEISGKTAMNAWSCLTSSFKAATSSKRRDLRVLDGRPNPCIGVEPPGDRESRRSRRKTFLFPREANALLSYALVPMEWREIYAIALFTYLRPGELRVLTWGDITAAGVSVTKAWDYEDGQTKMPKTRNGVRTVPIEPALLPLLECMREGREDTELVVPALSAFGEDHLAEQFRKHLKLAKLDRLELHASTRTHVQANFRSCRDSGITWLAIAGLGVDKIMRRCGHDSVATTLGYVKQAEDLAGDLGAPFAALPADLLVPRVSDRVSRFQPERLSDSVYLGCRRRELNPRPSAYETPALTN